MLITALICYFLYNNDYFKAVLYEYWAELQSAVLQKTIILFMEAKIYQLVCFIAHLFKSTEFDWLFSN